MKQHGVWLTLFLVIVLVGSVLTPHANASATANSELQLQSLTITPDQGSIVFLPTASSFASAQNSLGEFDSSFDSGSIANSTATVTWANGNCSVDSNVRTGSVATNSQIPSGLIGGSSSFALGTLSDFSFTVTGTTGEVPVQFDAVVPYMQMLFTDAYGAAASGVTFFLSLEGSTVLESQSAYSVGSNSSVSTSQTWDLSNSITLEADQAYSVEVMFLAVSTATTTPEPATIWLCLGAATPFLVRRLRATRP